MAGTYVLPAGSLGPVQMGNYTAPFASFLLCLVHVRIVGDFHVLRTGRAVGRRYEGAVGVQVEEAGPGVGEPVAGQVGGPFGDRGQGVGSGEDRSGGQGERIRQRVAAPATGPWIRELGQVTDQAGYVGFRGSSGGAEVDHRHGDREDTRAGTILSCDQGLRHSGDHRKPCLHCFRTHPNSTAPTAS